jgi:glyoxylase-like metal-dependent hydrolase (beta-lactamase superfamily II)
VFDRVPVPTPFQIGPVNAYVAGRTVVDPGPDSEDAWDALRTALGERRLEPADVEQVLVTHPHPDHFGLANRLREDGATVVVAEPPSPSSMISRGGSTTNTSTSASSSSAVGCPTRPPRR